MSPLTKGYILGGRSRATVVVHDCRERVVFQLSDGTVLTERNSDPSNDDFSLALFLPELGLSSVQRSPRMDRQGSWNVGREAWMDPPCLGEVVPAPWETDVTALLRDTFGTGAMKLLWLGAS